MCFAGSVLWTLTSESFFIYHCLIPWHYDYCNFICDKTLQQVRLYVRNSCPQQSAPRDRSVMGFIMFTHTLSSSAFPPFSWLRGLFVSLPVPFGWWGGGQCSFLISCFNLDCKTLFLIRKLLGGVSKRPGCWRSIWLWIGYVLSQALSKKTCLLGCGRSYSIPKPPAWWHYSGRVWGIKPQSWAFACSWHRVRFMQQFINPHVWLQGWYCCCSTVVLVPVCVHFLL